MYCCPKCESSEVLIVDATVDGSVEKDGTLQSLGSNLRFEPLSSMFCGACGHRSAAEKFHRADACVEPG